MDAACATVARIVEWEPDGDGRFVKLLRKVVRMTRSSCFCAIAMLAIVTLPAIGDDAPKKPTANPYAVALKTLADKGLTKQKPTPTSIPWVLPDDAKVAEKLAPLRKAELAHRTAAKKVKDLIVEVAKDRDALAKAEAHYQEIKIYADKPDTIPRNIAARFRSPQEMQQALQADINAQVTTINELRPEAARQICRRDAPDPENGHHRLDGGSQQSDSGVPCGGQRLRRPRQQVPGTGERPGDHGRAQGTWEKIPSRFGQYAQDGKAIAAAESKAVMGEVPFYREGSYDYVGALLNETTPVIVRIESVNAKSASWAPTEVLTKAGITIDPAAPVVTLTFGGNGSGRSNAGK